MTFTVTNLNDSGAGSLRAAVTAAEANDNEPTVDEIAFDPLQVQGGDPAGLGAAGAR